jgi:hypothetical protein
MSSLLEARNGFGTVLSLSTSGSGGTFYPVAGITSMNPPKKTLGVIDVTYHNAPDSYDECIPGAIFKQSPIGLTGIMITCSSFFAPLSPSSIAMWDLLDWLEDGTLIGWKIACGASTADVWYGDGYITDFGLEAPFNDVAKFSATITPTGKPSFGDST